jgi:hypothetical protein
MICTAQPQSIDATAAMEPMVFASEKERKKQEIHD